MDTTIQIQHRRERDEALATALGHVVLLFLTVKTNVILATVAVMLLFAWLATEQHTGVTILAVAAWVTHLSTMLSVGIAKGGAKL